MSNEGVPESPALAAPGVPDGEAAARTTLADSPTHSTGTTLNGSIGPADLGLSSKDQDKSTEGAGESPQAAVAATELPLYSPLRKSLAISFLSIGLILVVLDATLVTNALPTIARELDGPTTYAWVGTGYMLTSTAIGPLFGKIADIFGRKIVLQVCCIMFIAFSIMCALATSMPMLITARALQGVGGGGIQSLIFILVSEVVTMRERGKYQSLMMSLAGTAMVIGPIVGGAFTEHLSWRWCFWINVPLVGLSAIGQQFTLIPTGNRSSMRQKLARVDWIGAGLCIAGACLVLLGFTWSTDGWTTGKCLGGLISGAAILALFMVWEAYGAKEPAVPVWLFKSRTFVLACIIQVSLGWSMMGLAYFVPQYWQLTRGADAMSSSLMFLPFGVMWFLGSIVVGIASAKTGRYVEFPKIGFLVCTAMIAVMTACFTVDFNYYAAYTIEAILGLFLAVAMTLMMLIVQVGVDPRDLGPATAVGYFMRNLGSTMSIAVASSVVITVTTTNYTNMVPGFMAAGISPLAAKEYIMSMTSGTAPPTGLTQAQIELLAAGAAQAFDVGLRWVFGAQVPACFIAWIASLFLKHKPLSNKATGFQTRQAGDKTVHTIEDDKTTTVEIEDDDSKKNSQDKTHEEHKA